MDKSFHYSVLAVMALATSICYWPGLSGPFLFDDIPNIVINARIHITDLSWESLKSAVTSVESGPLRRPVSTLSFALNHYFFGLSPFAFKVTNLVIHVLNGAALYVLALLILNRVHIQNNSPFSTRYIYWVAAATGLLWIVHPLNLSSVLYIVQRMTSLSALFTTLGLIGYCMGRNQLIAGNKRGLTITIASIVIFGTVASLSKETGVLIFLYALVIEIFVYRFTVHDNLGGNYKKILIALFAVPITLGLLLAPFYAVSILKIGHYDMRQFTMAERLMTESRVIWFYLRLIAAPTPAALGLYHDYFIFSTSLTQPITTLVSIVFLLLLTGIGIAIRNILPIIALAIFWFLVGHSLESTVVPLELIHEHRNYLAMFGPILAAAYYLLYHANKPESLKLWAGLFVLIIALFATGTFARSSIWSNDYRMRLTQLLDHPNSARANSEMAILLHNNRKLDEAEHYFKEAARLDPEPPHQLLRLLQHLYAFHKPVPREHLDTLDFCAKNTPYSHVTIWQYEAILKQSRGVPDDHLRILHAYKTMISSNRVALSNDWIAKSYYLLGGNYIYLKQYQNAEKYLEIAVNTEAKPEYILKLANAYYNNNNLDKSRAALKLVVDRNSLPKSARKSYDALADNLKQKMKKK